MFRSQANGLDLITVGCESKIGDNIFRQFIVSEISMALYVVLYVFNTLYSVPTQYNGARV